MLNLFKLPFRFHRREEKSTPSTDIALGICKNFLRRNKKMPMKTTGQIHDFMAEELEAMRHKLKTSDEDFYELMSQSLRRIDDEFGDLE